MAGRHHVEPLDGVGLVSGTEFVEVGGSVRELGEELGGDFCADFVAARADAGADSGEKVARVGGEMHLHGADRLGGDAGKSASPAGVDGGDGAFLGVDEKDGDAVGGLDGKEEAGTLGNRSVAPARIGGRGVKEVDDVGMDLFEGEEGEIGCACGSLEAAAVFEDVFAGVPVGEAEVEDFFVG